MASNYATESNDITQADAAVSSAGDTDEYKMQHTDRGHAVIINIEKFTKASYSERKGSTIDAIAMKSLLHTLGFQKHKITISNDVDADQMLDIMKKASAEDYTDKDCFVCVILSHGNEGIVISNDCKPVQIANLVAQMGRKKCPKLAGKPKIFIIQACSGRGLDLGVTKTQHDGTTSDDKIDQIDDDMLHAELKNEPDFLIAHSSVEGYYAWLHPTAGSPFIQNLVKVISENWTQQDLLSMLTEVNSKVAEDNNIRLAGYDYKSQKNVVKQMPFFQSMLTKKMFFRRH